MRSRSATWITLALVAVSGCHHSPKTWTLVPPSPPAAQPKVFDLISPASARDPNNLPLNPLWGSQTWTTGAMLPPAQQATCAEDPRHCTSQTVVEDPAPTPSVCRLGVSTGLDNAGPIAAHLDWTIATYTGFVRPSLPAISDDDDYNFFFVPADLQGAAGLTESNALLPGTTKKYIELELLSHEVEQRFRSKWWTDFASDATRVLGFDDGDAQRRIDDAWAPGGTFRRATVIGLFGVDCEHGCRSELHPVYALMVETDPDPAHNVWQAFVRNWGSGGSCSTFNHEFSAPALTLRVPTPAAGATPARVVDAEFARSDDSIPAPVFSLPTSGDGLFVTFALAAPAQRALEELAITVAWSGAPAAPPPPPAPVVRPARVTPKPAKQSESAYILAAVDALPAAERADIRRRMVAALARPRRAAEQNRPVPQIDLTIHPSIPAVTGTTVPAAPPRTPLQDVATDRSRAVWSLLCEAYQGHPPPFNGQDVSSLCGQKGVTWKKK